MHVGILIRACASQMYIGKGRSILGNVMAQNISDATLPEHHKLMQQRGLTSGNSIPDVTPADENTIPPKRRRSDVIIENDEVGVFPFSICIGDLKMTVLDF
jgi:hypothetical protein